MVNENEHKSSFDKSYWQNAIRTSQNSIIEKPMTNERAKFGAKSFKNLYH
jgi:hypothetical protein